MQTTMSNEKLDSVLTNKNSIQIGYYLSTSDFGCTLENFPVYATNGTNMTYRYVLQELENQGFPFEGTVTNIVRRNQSGSYNTGFGGMFADVATPETYHVEY